VLRKASLMPIVAIVALATGSFAAAQTPNTAPPSSTTRTEPRVIETPPPSGAKILSEDEIRAKLQLEGYTNVNELQLQGVNYEAKATKDGRNVNLTVDARTGSVRSTY
jgi:hypothetical protein